MPVKTLTRQLLLENFRNGRSSWKCCFIGSLLESVNDSQKSFFGPAGKPLANLSHEMIQDLQNNLPK
jgi:hypothetical protein